ncbi:MAG TPA: LLM class flavin-dependent oxidoreductase, partial [Dehalococcoidia bacterium]|nr:LLM class flavin-dependent oxidoreductase [Dehalococcoidia bacterium]
IRFNVQATTGRWTYDKYRENWLLLEKLGYYVAYVVDHFVSYNPETGPTPIFEGPSVLSAMLALTTRMRGGVMVAGNTYRNPGILAKIACTLDHVSNGRMELGLGSGHTKLEHDQYNIPYYTQGTRLRMFAESIKIIRSLLTNERTTFEGKYYTMTDAMCEPKPVQQPFPILVGGIGEELSMRIVAESADIWNNWTSPDLDTYKQKLAALERHCADLGRDPNEIRKSMHIKPLVGETEAELQERAPSEPMARWQGTPEQLIEHLLTFVRHGVSDFVFMLDAPGDMRSLELIATQVAPTVRQEGEDILSESLAAKA